MFFSTYTSMIQMNNFVTKNDFENFNHASHLFKRNQHVAKKMRFLKM